MKLPGLAILTYHALDSSNAVTATDPAWFAETIERLMHAGFTGVDLASWVGRGCPEVAKGFAIAFDDGLQSVQESVDVVRRFALPATVFLVTEYVGGRNDWAGQPGEIPCVDMLDWPEIRSLSRMGFSLGAHTVTHARLDRVDGAEASRQMRESRLRIERETGKACTLLAYPYGRSNGPIRARAARQFDAAFGTRLDMACAANHRFDLPRIDAYYLKSSTVLERLIQQRLRPWLAVRRPLRTLRNVGRALIPAGS